MASSALLTAWDAGTDRIFKAMTIASASRSSRERVGTPIVWIVLSPSFRQVFARSEAPV
jgi:hypothetical protein